MTSNQFTLLVFILLLGFGGYLSHPILPPEIGDLLLVLLIPVFVVLVIGAVIYERISWWWQMRDLRRETRQIIEARKREDKALGFPNKKRLTVEEVIEREVARSIANREVNKDLSIEHIRKQARDFVRKCSKPGKEPPRQ
jgi:hypothetical protein